jgi:hypothetical protein
MVMLGEATPGMEEYEFGTCYVDFYSSMIKVPFLGSYFNTIMPVFILIFGFLFAALSMFKLKNKSLTALKHFTKKNFVEDGADVKADKPADGGKKDEESAKMDEREQTLVQTILKGEHAILQEFDQKKKREERNKLLRYNDHSAIDALKAKGTPASIEMTKTIQQ